MDFSGVQCMVYVIMVATEMTKLSKDDSFDGRPRQPCVVPVEALYTSNPFNGPYCDGILFKTLKTALSRESRQTRCITTPTRARFHHCCWSQPYHTTHVAALWQSMTSQWKPTTTVINQGSWDTAADNREAYTFLHWPMTLTYDYDF